MASRHVGLAWLGLIASGLTIGPASAEPYPSRDKTPAPAFAPVRVPLDQIAPGLRERVRAVVDQPTLATRGPVEAFACNPAVYAWLLDHPDQAVRLWRRLGAKCAEIQDMGKGRFAWSDGQGSEIHWDTVLDTSEQRIWFAEGHVKPGLLLPSVPIRAVVVLTHAEGLDVKGRPAVRHQAGMILHTDSRTAALAARLLGGSAPRMAEQYVGQIQTFYAALAWYLEQHPELAEVLGKNQPPVTTPVRPAP
jgi:hypothetical protein